MLQRKQCSEFPLLKFAIASNIDQSINRLRGSGRYTSSSTERNLEELIKRAAQMQFVACCLLQVFVVIM